MGFEEARVREQVATALEEAIEAGGLAPASRGFARRQAEVAKAALREPWDGEDGRSRLRAVQDERLERWLQRCSRFSPRSCSAARTSTQPAQSSSSP